MGEAIRVMTVAALHGVDAHATAVALGGRASWLEDRIGTSAVVLPGGVR